MQKKRITKKIIEEDCRKNKCQVNLWKKNGYRKIVAMVKNRTSSKNYTFDGYMDLHLQKARIIYDACFTDKYNRQQLQNKEIKSLNRAEKLIWPNNESPTKIIVDSIDLTKEKEVSIISIGSETQSQDVSVPKKKIVDLTKEKEQSQRVLADSEPISIISVREIQNTHVSLSSVRDEAISSIMTPHNTISELPNSEINTEEVLNQDYDRFDAIVLERVQSTQNSVPLFTEEFFDFSLNQEHDTDGIDWDNPT